NGWNAWDGASRIVDFSSLVEATPTAVYLYVKDGVGNVLTTQLSYDATYTKWAKDSSAPSLAARPVFTPSTNTWAYESSNTVYVKTGTIDFTVNDSGVGSGRYVFTTTSATPTDWGELKWSGGSAVNAALPSLIPSSSTGVKVWLHVKDDTGRVLAGSQLYYSDAADVWRLDNAAPTVPSTSPIAGSSDSANAIFTGGYIGTGSYPNLVHKGSGPFSVTISSGGYEARGIKGYASSATGTPVAAGGSISLTPDTSSIYVFDMVGNYTAVAVDYTLDEDVPELTASTFAATTGTLAGGGSGATLACYGQGFTTTFAASDDPSSVVSYAVSTAADAASVATANSIGGTEGWNSWNGTSTTVTFTSLVASTPTTVYLYVKDGVGNILQKQLSFDATYTKWAKDSNAPSVATGPAFTPAEHTWIYEASNVVYIKDGTFSFTPSDDGAGSGLWLIETSDAAPATAKWTAASSAGQTWTSGSAKTGIAIPASVPTTGSTSLYVHLKDAVGLSSSFEIINTGTGDKWQKDDSAPVVDSDHKLSGTSAAGTTYSGTALFATGAPPTLTYRLADSYVVSSLAVASGASDISGFSTTATPTALPDGTSVTLVTADSTKIYVFDKVGNYAEVAVAYTPDTTPPAFASWSSSDTTDDWKITSSMVSSTTDVAVGKYKKYADTVWTSLSAYNELTGLLYDTLYHMSITDAVGNEAQVFFKASYVSTTHTLTRVNHPMNWSWSSGAGIVSGLSLAGASSGANTVVGGAATGTVATGTSTITGVTAAGNYTLVLTDAKAKTLTLSYTLTTGPAAVALYTGAGAVNESVIGSRFAAAEKENGAYLARAYKEAIADEGKAAALWTEKPAVFTRRASTESTNGSAAEAQLRTAQDVRSVQPNALFVPVMPERDATDTVVRNAQNSGISARHAASLARFKQNSEQRAASRAIVKTVSNTLMRNTVWEAEDGENGDFVKKTSIFTEYRILDDNPLLMGVYSYMKRRGFDPAGLMDFTL
ncbi:MAG: hypothetical protein JXP39_03915, partial [Spirochaetales bacterium]|nr:hypothetical protein [Spirochaetales bacterium]